MDVLVQLEEKFDRLLNEISELKDENSRLKMDLEQAVTARDQIRLRIERLLEKIQEKLD